MKLQNGYKVIYEKVADGERTFFADKLDGTDATIIGNTSFKIGEYKLVYEKDGSIYGSTSGAVKDGVRIEAFDEVFVASDSDAATPAKLNTEEGPDEAISVEDEESGEDEEYGDENNSEE